MEAHFLVKVQNPAGYAEEFTAKRGSIVVLLLGSGIREVYM